MSRFEAFVDRDRRNGDARHGTASGAARHSRAGEDPCDACRAAKAEYDARRLESEEKAVRNRLHARAQGRALTDLRRLHVEECRQLYIAHKENLLREAGGGQ